MQLEKLITGERRINNMTLLIIAEKPSVGRERAEVRSRCIVLTLHLNLHNAHGRQ